MLRWAVCVHSGPVAVRYPRGGCEVALGDWIFEDPSKIHVLSHGTDGTILSYGTMMKEAVLAAEALRKDGIDLAVLRLPSANRYAEGELVANISGKDLFVLEDACSGSGMKENLAWQLKQAGTDCRIHGIDLGTEFVAHGDNASLYKQTGTDHESIAAKVREVLKHED